MSAHYNEDELITVLKVSEYLMSWSEYFLGWLPEDIARCWPKQRPHSAPIEELVVALLKENYLYAFQPGERESWFPKDRNVFIRPCITGQLFDAVIKNRALLPLRANVSEDEVERAMLSELKVFVTDQTAHQESLRISWPGLAYALEQHGIAARHPNQLIVMNKIDMRFRQHQIWRPEIAHKIQLNSAWFVSPYFLRWYFPE